VAYQLADEEIMTTTQAEATKFATGRSLVTPEFFARLSARIATEHDVDRSFAERIVDQALAFLGACAVSSAPLSPSATVDIGWHTFILHTEGYREFCDRIAGRFIDHVPTDGDGNVHPGALSTSLTALAVAEAGFVVDEPLWAGTGQCSQCHNGCQNDPPPDPKVVDDHAASVA
jgi:hypothetical protein